MVDNCRVNEVVRYYLETAKNKDMTEKTAMQAPCFSYGDK